MDTFWTSASVKKCIFCVPLFFYFSRAEIHSISDETALKKNIGQMVIGGFTGKTYEAATNLHFLLTNCFVGGIIFRQPINILNKDQFRTMVNTVKSAQTGEVPLFLCADEEGGKVHFLQERFGYTLTNISAADLGKINKRLFTRKYYRALARTFRSTGLNFNFAPCIDLAVNPENPVIAQLGRSYSHNPEIVLRHARLFMKAMKKNRILFSIKHYPGHGNTVKDSHHDFIDITETHTEKELRVFHALLKKSPAVMTAHLLHRGWDPLLPASMSAEFQKKHLRHARRYQGLIISDDIEMKALSEKFTIDEITRTMIQSGTDIILAGGWQTAVSVCESIYRQVLSGKIPYGDIDRAAARVRRVKQRHLSR